MRIVYINLADRTDRRARMEVRLGRLGLAARRVEAITPDQLSPAVLARFCDPAAFRSLSPEALARALSHALALEQILESPFDQGLVLEDDAVLSPGLPAFLSALGAGRPAAGVVRIEAGPERLLVDPLPAATLAGIGLHRLRAPARGAVAYVASRTAALRLIAGEEMCLSPLGEALFGLSPLQAMPGLAAAETGAGSDPGTRRGPHEPHERAVATAWPRRLHHLARHLLTRDIPRAARVLSNGWRGTERRVVPFLHG